MKYLLTLCCLYFTTNSFSQVTRLDSLLSNQQYNHVERELSELMTFNKDSNAYWYYAGKLQMHQRNLQQALNALKKVDTTTFKKQYKAWYYYVLGDVYRYSNQEEKAYKLKLKAQKLFHASGNEKMANEVNYDLYYTLSSQDHLQYNGTYYAKEYYKKASTLQDTLQLSKAHLILSRLENSELTEEEIKNHLKKATEYVNAIGMISARYRLFNYKAIYHRDREDFITAEVYLDSMLYCAKQMNSPDRMQSTLRTKASNYYIQEKYREAIGVLKEAEKLPIRENVFNRKKELYRYLALNHKNLGNMDSAFSYYEKMIAHGDSINLSKQNTMLTLLETVELSQKNLLLDAERIKQRENFIIVLIVLIAVIIISIIWILYYRSKKLLAEKEKQLAEKEKEIKAIDARNDEKDKQRQRIAGELHDNLGHLIIAIQQCFDNLKVSKDRFQQEEDKLMSKTQKLINEAYLKVRNMSHLEDSASQNSGYWVDVIKEYAAIMNESNQLSVEVQSHGTANIVNISIENDLRRMTTELITNAVKHSEASEVSVDITAGEKSITIIVEDDGVGLDKDKLKRQKGLGLNSIQKKAEELKGKLTIDSVANKGTTFIIEIPL
ncbi:sensor histidine kinase [Kordia sp.]|uniref:sensor histidine kinase n=1 Tax=Kordia sp. TaxID=1965332 RepID=UPI003B5BB9F2